MNTLRIAAIFTFLAGLSHLTIQSYEHMNMHFYLVGFLMTGLIQVLLGILLWKKKTLSSHLFWVTTFVHGGAFVFWLLTRTMQAPFMEGVEHFTLVGGIIAFLQLATILLLLWKKKNILYAIFVIMGSTFLGFASHFGAMHLEAHFPEMKMTGGHHSKMSPEEHRKMMLPTDQLQTDTEESSHDHTNCENDVCPNSPDDATSDHHQ